MEEIYMKKSLNSLLSFYLSITFPSSPLSQSKLYLPAELLSQPPSYFDLFSHLISLVQLECSLQNKPNHVFPCLELIWWLPVAFGQDQSTQSQSPLLYHYPHRPQAVYFSRTGFPPLSSVAFSRSFALAVPFTHSSFSSQYILYFYLVTFSGKCFLTFIYSFCKLLLHYLLLFSMCKNCLMCGACECERDFLCPQPD